MFLAAVVVGEGAAALLDQLPVLGDHVRPAADVQHGLAAEIGTAAGAFGLVGAAVAGGAADGGELRLRRLAVEQGLEAEDLLALPFVAAEQGKDDLFLATGVFPGGG